MDKPRIDLTVMYDQYNRSSYPENFDSRLSVLSKLIGFDYAFRLRDEEQLEFDPRVREIFPENGLFYVHGGLRDNHTNFDLVCQISPQRPDLRFIVEFDGRVQRDDFTSPESYQRYREGLRLDSTDLLNSLNAVRETSIIISSDGINNVLAYSSHEHPSNFHLYLAQLLKTRKSP